MFFRSRAYREAASGFPQQQAGEAKVGAHRTIVGTPPPLVVRKAD